MRDNALAIAHPSSMENAALMEALLDVAERCDLEVRSAGGEGAPNSGVCRVGRRFWVVLSARDPVEVQIDVLAAAIVQHAGESLDAQFVPPAVRARLELATPAGREIS